MDILTILAVFIASAIVAIVSLISAFSLYVDDSKLSAWLPRLIAIAVGVLLGDAFLHLIPDALEIESETGGSVAMWTLVGIMAFFFMESVLHWRHEHDLELISKNETSITPASYAKMNLMGDGAHNFVDGVLIASSFLVSPSLGIATTIAIVLHEIPQEISDIAVLIHGGYTKKRAVLLNFLCSLACLAGASCTLLLSQLMELGLSAMLSFTAGGFIYIASSDLVPLLRSKIIKINLSTQFAGTLIGILSMQSILWFENLSHF